MGLLLVDFLPVHRIHVGVVFDRLRDFVEVLVKLVEPALHHFKQLIIHYSVPFRRAIVQSSRSCKMVRK